MSLFSFKKGKNIFDDNHKVPVWASLKPSLNIHVQITRDIAPQWYARMLDADCARERAKFG